MMEPQHETTVDMRTAQNRMFSFIRDELQSHIENGDVAALLGDETEVNRLYASVKEQLMDLLCIPQDMRDSKHIGIVDSGKRAIEVLVSYFCRPQQEANSVVSTENYVAFNKFSARTALTNMKGVDFAQPFQLNLGRALTRGSEEDFGRAVDLIRTNRLQTIWLAWNSTSTGVRERVERLVRMRNESGSETLIICDAASLPLFSNDWESLAADELPDVFFVSMRKQGLFYEGPQDEANQARNSGGLYIFNDRALTRATTVAGESLYDTPQPEEAASHKITKGSQRSNHICHLLKLQSALSFFLADNRAGLVEQDKIRRSIHGEICQAFTADSQLGKRGFRLLADPDVQSETAYILKMPDSVQSSDLVKYLKEQDTHISISMHPQLPARSYCRFACYPANRIEESKQLLDGIARFAQMT